MANTTIKFKRQLDSTTQLTSNNILAPGEPLWFASTYYTNTAPKLFIGNSNGAAQLVGPYTGGTGISVVNSLSSTSLGEISLNATLNDLNNVNAASPSNGQVLTYNSATSSWIPGNTDSNLTLKGSYGFVLGGYGENGNNVPSYVIEENDTISPNKLNIAANKDLQFYRYEYDSNYPNVYTHSALVVGYPFTHTVDDVTHNHGGCGKFVYGDKSRMHVLGSGGLSGENGSFSMSTYNVVPLGISVGNAVSAQYHQFPMAGGVVLQHNMLTGVNFDYTVATVSTPSLDSKPSVYVPVIYSTVTTAPLYSTSPKSVVVPISAKVVASAIKTKSSLISDESAGEVGVNNLHFKYTDSEIADDVQVNQERGYYVFSLMSTEAAVSAYNGCNITYSVLDFGNTTNTQLNGVTLQDVTINLPFEANTDPTCECTHYLLIKNGTEVDLPISLSFSSTLKNTYTIIGNLTHNVASDDNLEIRIKITTTGEVVVTTELDNVAYVGKDEGQAGGVTSVPVNDATITLQVNGTTVDSFTVNAANNKTINLPISGGSGGGDTVVGKSNVTLGTTATAVLQVNGSDSGSVALPSASTSAAGIVQLSSSTSSTSTSTAATPSAVKSAYDLANNAIPKSIGTTAGDIIYFTGSSTPTRLAKGTAGQVLTMNSGATAPEWQTPSNGNVTEIAWCTYNYSTHTMDMTPAEIYTAYTSGKCVICKTQDGSVLSLNACSYISNEYFITFSSIDSEDVVALKWGTGDSENPSWTEEAGSFSNPGTLNTTATTAQSTNSSESLSGSVTLHKVAKTGTYSDLIGTPTIPTVNNSTITIQKNSATVDTFTTNASSAKTINIPVNELPTVTSSDNGKALIVSNGAWAATSVTTIYTGSSAPASGTGSNGDIYIQTAS